MSKSLKKGLIVGGSIIGVILIIMLLIPIFFKGKVKDIVVEMANENLNAEVVIDGFGLNLFSNFPNATLTLEDALIIGKDEFKQDTLLNAKAASVTIDLFSLFGDNYNIRKISLDGTTIYAKVAENGKANWDIVKEDPNAATAAEESNDSPFNLDLKNIIIKNVNIIYEDFESNVKAYIMGWNGNAKGDFSASETTLTTNSVIDELTIMMDGIPYLSKVKGTADAKLNANFDNMKFTFMDSKFLLNDLVTSLDGSFGFVNEDGIEFDLKMKAPDADFKQVLSLMPAMYTEDFKGLKADGSVSLDAYVVGVMEGETYPAFDLRLSVHDAMFQYPSLPKSVDAINLLLTVNGKGGSLDNVMVLVDKFSFMLGGNKFKGSFRMTPAGKDKSIEFNADGRLNLGMIKEVYPLESGIELNGVLDADIKVETTMSAIEKEMYESINAKGHLKLANMLYKSPEMPDVKINSAALEFTPKYANLSDLNIAIGKSDIEASGRLENFIAYALKNKTLRGSLNIQSKFLDLDELMGGDEAPAEEGTEVATDAMIIPKNIDFALSAGLSHVLFNKIDITSLSGAITVKDGVVAMRNVGASALGGLANVNGSYNTSDTKNPKVDFDLKLTNVSFAKTFNSVESIQKFAPIFEDLKGTFSMDINFNTKLGATSDETLRALSGKGLLQTSDVKLENNKTLAALGSALKTDKLNNIAPKDLKLPFEIKDGALATDPFKVNFGDGGEMELAGVTRLDQTIDYKGTVKLPKSMDNKVLSKVPLTIGGTFSSPKVGVDMKAAATDAATNVIGGLLGIKKGDGGSASSTSSLKGLSEEDKAKKIEEIRADADKRASKIEDAAKEESDKIVAKAGSNALAKAAAKGLAKKAVDEAKKEGKKIRDQAEEQIKQLEAEAAE